MAKDLDPVWKALSKGKPPESKDAEPGAAADRGGM